MKVSMQRPVPDLPVLGDVLAASFFLRPFCLHTFAKLTSLCDHAAKEKNFQVTDFKTTTTAKNQQRHLPRLHN